MSPGARALADQLVSVQPGLILQISGKLTHQCINVSTIFVDHFFDHVYAYLMKDLTLDETITAKHGYEFFLHLLGIQSKAYHADNGCFADQGFRDDCLQNNQLITVCGFGSIIRIALLRERSKILRSALEQCYFMQKECFLSIFQLSFGLLH
jgi:hypothetical protein